MYRCAMWTRGQIGTCQAPTDPSGGRFPCLGFGVESKRPNDFQASTESFLSLFFHFSFFIFGVTCGPKLGPNLDILMPFMFLTWGTWKLGSNKQTNKQIHHFMIFLSSCKKPKKKKKKRTAQWAQRAGGLKLWNKRKWKQCDPRTEAQPPSPTPIVPSPASSLAIRWLCYIVERE